MQQIEKFKQRLIKRIEKMNFSPDISKSLKYTVLSVFSEQQVVYFQKAVAILSVVHPDSFDEFAFLYNLCEVYMGNKRKKKEEIKKLGIAENKEIINYLKQQRKKDIECIKNVFFVKSNAAQELRDKIKRIIINNTFLSDEEVEMFCAHVDDAYEHGTWRDLLGFFKCACDGLLETSVYSAYYMSQIPELIAETIFINGDYED